MVDFAADSYADIARRHAELFGAAVLRAPVKARWAIWFEPGDRDPGWCRIDGITGKWGLSRSDSDPLLSLFDTEHDARNCIDNKRGGAWSTDDMAPRQFEGW